MVRGPLTDTELVGVFPSEGHVTDGWRVVHVLNVCINLEVIARVDCVPIVWRENHRVVSATVTETLNRRLIVGCEGWCAVADGDRIEGDEAACLIPYCTQGVAGADVCCQAFYRHAITVKTVTVGDPVIVGGVVGWLTVPREGADTVLCDHASLVNTTPWVDGESEAATIPVTSCFGEEDGVSCIGCADNAVQQDGGFLCCDVWDSIVGGDEVHGLLLVNSVCVELHAWKTHKIVLNG